MLSRFCLGLVAVTLSLAPLGCCKREASARSGPDLGLLPTAPRPSTQAPPDDAKLEAALGRLGTTNSKSAEDELVAGGRASAPKLAGFMLAQDAKRQKAPKEKRWDYTKTIMRAIAVSERLGADGLPPLMFLHRSTKDSGIRSISCEALKRGGSSCPAGVR